MLYVSYPQRPSFAAPNSTNFCFTRVTSQYYRCAYSKTIMFLGWIIHVRDLNWIAQAEVNIEVSALFTAICTIFP
jgi:hypothetical protein